MRGDQDVIELLNEVLTGELTAINQYFIHAKMCENWGYTALFQKVRAESIDEMRHADEVISRILFLEGVPNLQRLSKLSIGETVPEQFQADLDLEYAAIERLNRGVELCRAKKDNASRELIERILVDEEQHADWLETQLSMIEDMGLPHYLAQQTK